MRPVLSPAKLEIVGIGFLLQFRSGLGLHNIGNGVALGIIFGFFARVKTESDLRGRVARCPAHQRVCTGSGFTHEL